MKYALGIVGGILFGILASLPWVLVYVWGGWIVALLAIPIALGIKFGYKLFKGPEIKALPIIIGVITILIVAAVCLVVMPMYMLHTEGYLATFNNLGILYENGLFTELLKDLVICLVFAALGISGTLRETHKKGDLPAEKEKELSNY